MEWEVSEQVRGGGRLGERDKREAFAFWYGVWVVLVMGWEKYTLYKTVIA